MACRLRKVTHDPVCAAAIGRHLAGVRVLDIYRLAQIADKLDVYADWLLGRSDMMEPQEAGFALGQLEADCMKELESRNAAACKELCQKYGEAVEEAIRLARATGERQTVLAPGGAEAFAYPVLPTFACPTGGIAWGLNSAEDSFNVWRGIRRPDGKDMLKIGLKTRPSPAQPRAGAPEQPNRSTPGFDRAA